VKFILPWARRGQKRLKSDKLIKKKKNVLPIKAPRWQNGKQVRQKGTTASKKGIQPWDTTNELSKVSKEKAIFRAPPTGIERDSF
jgi:hypothetical protein